MTPDALKSNEDRAPRAWPRFMTARVAADYCDTSPWTIRRHIQPCGRRGRCFIYSIESIETWMRGQAVKPARADDAAAPAKARQARPNVASIARIRKVARSEREDRTTPLARKDALVAA